jgi:hypothetical protein
LVEEKVISNEVFMELSKFMGLETFKCVEEFLKNVLALIGGEV